MAQLYENEREKRERGLPNNLHFQKLVTVQLLSIRYTGIPRFSETVFLLEALQQLEIQ